MQNVLKQVLSNQSNSIFQAGGEETKLSIGRFLPESLIDEYKNNVSRTNKFTEIQKQNPLSSVDDIKNLTAKTILEDQVSRVNKFLNHNAVTAVVKDAYENAKFDMFDPSTGDNNCESRVFLLEIFALKNSAVVFDNLSTDFKMVLTLSYILREYRLDERDVFGLYLGSKKANPAIIIPNGHNKVNLQSYSNLPKGNNGSPIDLFSNAAELMAHAMSEISCNYMLNLDETLTSCAFKDDLKPYQREIGNIAAKKRPKQQYVAPTFILMLKQLSSVENQVYALKMTQMSCTSLAGSKSYKCDGAFLLYRKVQNGNLVVVDASSVDGQIPIAVFETFSIRGDTDFSSYQDEILVAPFAKTQDFNSYKQALSDNADLVDSLIIKESMMIDSDLSKKLSYANADLESQMGEAQRIITCVGKKYCKDGKNRGSSTSILSGCHFYISTKDIETQKIASLPPSNIVVGMVVNFKSEQELLGGKNV